MTNRLKSRIPKLFQKEPSAASIDEQSSLNEILKIYTEAEPFIERKYGVRLDVKDKQTSLKEFVDRYGLPPAQVLFMEIQMASRKLTVKEVTPTEVQALRDQEPDLKILDVRETWEVDICRLPLSERLTPELLDEILKSWSKSTPILLYCHFGIRSLDAATFLLDRGFTQVFSLNGGIDSWAVQIDPTMTRYDQAWC